MGERITKEVLDKIIEDHGHWLKEDCPDWETKRASLIGADLRGANLRGADLMDSDLSGADLRDADLFTSDLRGAILRGTNLSGASLISASLRFADLRDTNLSGASLRGAILSGASLSGADLRDADLRDASLSGSDLSGADLSCANLNGANLSGANLIDAKNVPFIPMACPDVGEFIGWKKCFGDLIVKLKIPATAKRSSACGRKCRCSEAIVLSIETISEGPSCVKVAKSIYNKDFVYKLGKTVKVDNFCEDRFNECAPGIHFFINRQEAVDYSI